jgi:hypothetical protein
MRLTRCALLLLAVTASPANAGSKAERAREKAQPTSCPEAGRAKVTLPDGINGIDGVRVFVTDARPGAATDVTVLAAGRDRTVRAFVPGEMILSMDEPLRARTVEVALEPVFDATHAACVERVELLRGGAVVGTAEIR